MLNDLNSQLGQSLTTVRRLLERPGSGAANSRLPEREARQLAREERLRRTKLMRRELYLLLEQHPESRTLMRHLDLVERTLRAEGFTAVEALPVPVLSKALAQLERLVWDWSPAGLAELRSRLAILVKTHRASRVAADPDTAPAVAAVAPVAAPPRPAAVAPEAPTLVVSEVDHAVFEEMERSWAGRVPAPAAQAAPAAA